MATVGIALGAISESAYSLMLAGAITSIVISPTLHSLGAAAVNRWERRQARAKTS